MSAATTSRLISWMPSGQCGRCGAGLVSPVWMTTNATVLSVVGPGYPPDTPTHIHVCPIPPEASPS